MSSTTYPIFSQEELVLAKSCVNRVLRKWSRSRVALMMAPEVQLLDYFESEQFAGRDVAWIFDLESTAQDPQLIFKSPEGIRLIEQTLLRVTGDQQASVRCLVLSLLKGDATIEHAVFPKGSGAELSETPEVSLSESDYDLAIQLFHEIEGRHGTEKTARIARQLGTDVVFDKPRCARGSLNTAGNWNYL